MRRREFLAAAAAASWPLSSGNAQQSARIRRIAILSGGAESDPEQRPRATVFRRMLRDLGWSEGDNLVINHRYAGGETMQMSQLARELVARNPDVMLAATTPAVAALRQHTSSIPIVFVAVSDPVGRGFVASLARPGGNVTGFMNDIAGSLSGKWIELLKEIAPNVARAAMIFNPDTAPQSVYYLSTFESAARAAAVEPIAARVRSIGEIAEAIDALGQRPDAGLVVMPDAFVATHRKAVIEQAVRHRIPVMAPFGFFAREGGLLSYGIDFIEQYKGAAFYVHRILGGERPADLPVQAPTTFELVINLKTAKSIGLAVPPTMLALADEVIE